MREARTGPGAEVDTGSGWHPEGYSPSMTASLKRIWNKLFGSGSSDPSMTEREKNVAREAMARQQAERQRLQEELNIRNGRNTIGYF